MYSILAYTYAQALLLTNCMKDVTWVKDSLL